ncbi:unnamed protein product [Haemonchus placei]|uniref:KOW domain-containing protein n=1 Tax=Haemonchus placei TaxID=6290 RepID=A0A158QK29_HAEPC|nr:unnamed protein product [Haemonchus placei]
MIVLGTKYVEGLTCDEVCIGETGRMQGICVKEHLAGKDVDIECKIVDYENEIGAKDIGSV